MNDIAKRILARRSVNGRCAEKSPSHRHGMSCGGLFSFEETGLFHSVFS